MTSYFTIILRDAWALFRRDRDLLIRVAAPFLFLPAFALALLVPPWPLPDTAIVAREAQTLAWINAIQGWMSNYGFASVVAYALIYFGMAVIFALYLDPAHSDVRTAFGRTIRVFPRFFLAMVLISLPAAAGLLFLLVIPGLYVLGRTMLAGPALLAERPIGAWSAIRRSVVLSRGRGLPLMALVAASYLGGLVTQQPFVLLEEWMRAGGHANPVAVAIVDAAAAGVAMLSGLATALIAVSAYRRQRQ